MRARWKFSLLMTPPEIKLGKADTTHPAAFNENRFEIFTNHQFRRSAANINNQFATFFRLGMFHSHKNQTGFFITGNNFNRVGNDLFRAFQKVSGVQRLTQRMGTNYTDAGRRKPL